MSGYCRNIVALSGQCQMLEVCRICAKRFPGDKCLSQYCRNVRSVSGRPEDVGTLSGAFSEVCRDIVRILSRCPISVRR